MSVPLYSVAEEPAQFSPTVPVFNVVEEHAQGNHNTTILVDSTWVSKTPNVDPSKAMYHSLLLPGWGQLENGKKKKAALIIAAEVICIGGYLYQSYRIKNENFTDWEMSNMRTDRNSFIIYFMVAKLYGMVDAYVDAHLAGFNVKDITPEELKNKEK